MLKEMRELQAERDRLRAVAGLADYFLGCLYAGAPSQIAAAEYRLRDAIKPLGLPRIGVISIVDEEVRGGK
jgi:hypothetical protein